MKLREQTVALKDGGTAFLRSPGPTDAAAVLDLMRRSSDETHFMAREGNEISLTEAQEAEFLDRVLAHPGQLELAAFVDGKPVGVCGLDLIRDTRRCRHRAELGIAILREYWGRGLGTAMVRACLEAAKEAGFEQVELGVCADNPRAIHTYEKLGFRAVGTVPRAYKLSDGMYRDEVQMVFEIAGSGK